MGKSIYSEPLVTTSIGLPKETIDKLDVITKQEQRSVSNIIRLALNEYISRYHSTVKSPDQSPANRGRS